MIKQGIFKCTRQLTGVLQIVCSSKFSEDDDAIDIEMKATNDVHLENEALCRQTSVW